MATMQDSSFRTYVRGSDMNRQLAAVLLILSASLQPSQAAEYVYPGVYLQEGPGPKRIDGVSTSPNLGQVRMCVAAVENAFRNNCTRAEASGNGNDTSMRG